MQTELYNLAADPFEAHDISAQHPEIIARLQRIMQDEHHPSELFPISALDVK